MKKILIGGSPCNFWTIAKNRGERETKPNGEGWELFRNFVIAKEKFKPDFFLYENNKTMAEEIKREIETELGIKLRYIDSSLVSAQGRKRVYGFNIPGVEAPADRGILISDLIPGAKGAAKRNQVTKKGVGKYIAETPGRAKQQLKENTTTDQEIKNKDVWNKCENCIYYGTAADAPETVEPECMWQPNEENGYDLPCVEVATKAAEGAAERVLEYGA